MKTMSWLFANQAILTLKQAPPSRAKDDEVPF